jgi:hypothetical protein
VSLVDRVFWGNHNDATLEEPLVEWGWIAEGRPLQTFTEEQLEALPDSFRCFNCQAQFKKRDIGGIDRRQKLCRFCYPLLSDWEVGAVIKFDLAHSKPVTGFEGNTKTSKELVPIPRLAMAQNKRLRRKL